MFSSVLPLYGVCFDMVFTAPSSPGRFHQGALTAWLRTVLGDSEQFSNCICSESLQHKGHFKAGDVYRFAVFGIGELGREMIARIPSSILMCRPCWDAPMPFRDNWLLHSIGNIDGSPLQNLDEVPELLNTESLHQRVEQLQTWKQMTIDLTAPLRVLKKQSDRQGMHGEQRYCHQPADFMQDHLWLTRILDSLRRLIENRGGQLPEIDIPPALVAKGDMRWMNASYKSSTKKVQPMGGLIGQIMIPDVAILTPELLAALVLGSYLGIGQRRVFGNGRYGLRAG